MLLDDYWLMCDVRCVFVCCLLHDDGCAVAVRCLLRGLCSVPDISMADVLCDVACVCCLRLVD